MAAPTSGDRVRDALHRMVKYVRSKNQAENLEFEIRLGQFTAANDFEPGFRHEHMEVVSRLRSRIQKNTQAMPSIWTEVEPMYTMIRCEYDGNIRKTCRIRNKVAESAEYILKRRAGKVDILTDRPYHIRATVSRETKLNITPTHHMYKTVTQNPPKSVRYVTRASFLETIPSIPGFFLGTEDNKPIAFQWDISKVSESGANKQQATNDPCSYHCEFELRNKLITIEDPEKENQLNLLLVDLIISRIRALVGSHLLDKATSSLTPLPPAQLSLLVKDV